MTEVRVSKDYIGDPCVTIKLQGLRYIARVVDKKVLEDDHYILFWAYKGQEIRYRYPTKEARDAMYNAVSLALTKPNKEDPK